MASTSFQILSDLHLETPSARPTYSEYSFKNTCPYLALLGDIGHATDQRLFDFLEHQLLRFKIGFYLLGNHEPYGGTLEAAREAMRTFQDQMPVRRTQESDRGELVFLDQTRYDIAPNLTILGCTLSSRIDPDQASSIQRFVSDFEQIQNWSIDGHNIAHKSDLEWLNEQVKDISQNEPDRRIAIFTHYSPTVQPEANDPRHLRDDSSVRSAFMTDLSNEPCWKSPAVALWAFGHTHFNCDFVDSMTGKRVMANQKGYKRSEAEGFDSEKVVTVSVPHNQEINTGAHDTTTRTVDHKMMISDSMKPGKVKSFFKSLRPGS